MVTHLFGTIIQDKLNDVDGCSATRQNQKMAGAGCSKISGE